MFQKNSTAAVKLWALVLSVVLHLVVLGSFIFIGFSDIQLPTNHNKAPARLTKNILPIQSNQNFTKPKVIKPNFLETGKIEITNLPTTSPKNITSDNTSNDNISKNINLIEDSFIIPTEGIEFFTIRTFRKKICFVVDSSGSMQGIFEPVKGQLAESINSLQQDQYFCIIFFGSDSLTQFGNNKFLRASNNNKTAAQKFISKIRPTGPTNALAGLKKALRICAMDNTSQTTIFFLTDGFELGGQQSADFAAEVINFRKALAPATKINTIGFDVNAQNRDLLINIANSTSGTFTAYDL